MKKNYGKRLACALALATTAGALTTRHAEAYLISGNSDHIGYKVDLHASNPGPISLLELRRTDRELKTLTYLHNEFNRTVAFADRNADAYFSYDIEKVPMSPAGLDTYKLVSINHSCSVVCEQELYIPDDLAGWIPVIIGFHLDFNGREDHRVTNVQVMIDDSNILTVGFNEKDKGHDFTYLVQYGLLDPSLVAEPHVRVSNEGALDKGMGVYTRPDTGGTPLLKGFSLTFKSDESGFGDDTHGLANFGFDLLTGEVEFNDGDADDFFEYVLTYATLL